MQFDPWIFGALCVIILALATILCAEKVGVLNRDQTDEWKEWMQSNAVAHGLPLKLHVDPRLSCRSGLSLLSCFQDNQILDVLPCLCLSTSRQTQFHFWKLLPTQSDWSCYEAWIYTLPILLLPQLLKRPCGLGELQNYSANKLCRGLGENAKALPRPVGARMWIHLRNRCSTLGNSRDCCPNEAVISPSWQRC